VAIVSCYAQNCYFKFKADCSRLIREVSRAGKPWRITNYGRLIIEIIPIAARKRFVLGDMAGTVHIVGDIISPVIKC
jgi:antitoxin (DNA-binding transcriptional repressor) of toxin-antitoxin stability system